MCGEPTDALQVTKADLTPYPIKFSKDRGMPLNLALTGNLSRGDCMHSVCMWVRVCLWLCVRYLCMHMLMGQHVEWNACVHAQVQDTVAWMQVVLVSVTVVRVHGSSIGTNACVRVSLRRSRFQRSLHETILVLCGTSGFCARRDFNQSTAADVTAGTYDMVLKKKVPYIDSWVCF